jgi:hypothetical protein
MTLDGKLMEHKGEGPPRRLRVVEWIFNCARHCNLYYVRRAFHDSCSGSSRAMAQANLQYQFDRHKCTQ